MNHHATGVRIASATQSIVLVRPGINSTSNGPISTSRPGTLQNSFGRIQQSRLRQPFFTSASVNRVINGKHSGRANVGSAPM